MPNVTIDCGCNTTDDTCYPFCPIESKSVFFLTGVDRNCDPVRLEKYSSGLVWVDKNDYVKILDGSNDNPIKLKLPSKQTSDGSIVIQDSSGRVISVSPIESEDTLYLSNTGGVFSFTKFNQSAKLNPDEIVNVSSGNLAVIACGGQGGVSIGNLVLGSDYPTPSGQYRYLVIGSDNIIRPADSLTDEPVSLTEEETASYIKVVKDGKDGVMTLNEGEFLTGDGSGNVIKKEINIGIHKLQNPQTIYSYTGSGTPVNQSTTVDADSINGVPEEARALIITTSCHLNRTGDSGSFDSIQVQLNGLPRCSSSVSAYNRADANISPSSIDFIPSSRLVAVSVNKSGSANSVTDYSVAVIVEGYIV